MKIEQNNILNDSQQIIFDEILRKLKEKRILNIFTKTPKGFYIYGSVGSGKTFLMRKLYEHLSGKKSFFHYHNFMTYVHNLLKEEKLKENKIRLVAKKISRESQYIFIDELEILDITDAMLMKDLVAQINNNGTKIFFTTNIPPNNLYQDGIQRESFLPFIEYLEDNFGIFNLSSDTDLRTTQKDKKNQHFFHPNNESNNKILEKKLFKLSQNQVQKDSLIEINKHKFNCKYLSSNIISFDFADIFEGNSSTRDFEFLTSTFPFIAIFNARKINRTENNIIKRFINFIDLVYINKTNLFISSEVEVFDLYNEGRYEKEFRRCSSRLKEMESFYYE